MSLSAKEIPLFENLAQFEFDQAYYDFHNDFICEQIIFENSCIDLLMKHRINNEKFLLRFLSAEIIKINYLFIINNNGLTIDNLYRGRFQLDGNLFECNNDQKSYFYLEFYEGQTMEFFCDSVEVKKC